MSRCTLCDKAATAPRGWCWAHYNKWRRYGYPIAGFEQQTCAAESCTEPSRVSGMCDKHYRRTRKHGDPTMGRPTYGPSCSVDGCNKAHAQAGMCTAHYYRHWVDNGNGKALMAAASARRRARVAKSPDPEHALSWLSLWSEGERSCYLCGVQCDPTDYRHITNRAGREQKICGPTHPSLDHVTALANGGHHARDNARLACMRCNRRKHSKVSYEAEHGTAR